MKRLLISGYWLLAALFTFGQGWEANPAVVERLSKSNSQFNYYESEVPKYVLPNVLANSKGAEIVKPKEWTKTRRGEVLEMFRENVFGRVPSTPYLKTGSDLPEVMPPLNTPVTGGKVGFHIRDGGHNLLLKDWNWFMDFADKVWK